MIKIFYYELHRLLLNKLSVCILAVSLGYGWLILTRTTIQGIAHTAPFSPWSFGDYISRTLPMICLGEFFFLTFFTSRQEQRAEMIIRATPVNFRKYAAVRCGAVLLGTLGICLGVIGLALGFCSYFFKWKDFGSLMFPALLALFPAVIFCLGLGWALGKFHPMLVYGAIAIPFLLSWLPLPWLADFSMGRFFSEYPLTIETLDPAFAISVSMLCGRIIYLILGIMFFWWSQIRQN